MNFPIASPVRRADKVFGPEKNSKHEKNDSDNLLFASLRKPLRGKFCPKGKSVELIRDLKFRNGITLYDPTPGRKTVSGRLDFGRRITGDPIWNLPQWSSRWDLNSAPLQKGKDGELFYENPGKKFAIRPDGTFYMEIRGRNEYGDRPRQWGEYWPHLYLGQPLDNDIPLDRYQKLIVTLEGKTVLAENHTGAAYDPKKLHTVHVVSHLTVRNVNKDSKDYPSAFEFSIPVYDFRYDFVPAKAFFDTGGKKTVTNMFVYGPAGKDLWSGPFRQGQWQRMEFDALPYILKGLEEARKRGKFVHSSPEDFRIVNYRIGWECEGTFNAAMMFKNLSVKAYLK